MWPARMLAAKRVFGILWYCGEHGYEVCGGA